MAEIAGVASEGPLALAVGTGMQVMAAMFDEDVARLEQRHRGHLHHVPADGDRPVPAGPVPDWQSGVTLRNPWRAPPPRPASRSIQYSYLPDAGGSARSTRRRLTGHCP